MGKEELNTKKNTASVAKFLARVKLAERREDCWRVLKLMGAATKEKPRMWGPSIVGFGTYRYKYPSGREGEWFLTGFSPRKENLTLYFMSGFGGHPEAMRKLGKFKTGQSCLYIQSLEDLHLPTLRKLMKDSIRVTRERFA